MITSYLAAEVKAFGGMFPVYVHTIEHPDGLVLVDTGMIDSRPELDEAWGPVPHPLPAALISRVDRVINTHLHFDHCGGNRLFPGVPIHVQARELSDARTQEDYTIPEWVDFGGASYVEHEGEAEILPGVSVLPAPGHTDGHHIVLVETEEGPVVLGGDVAYSFRELGEGKTEGQRLVLELGVLTWLAHAERPQVPRRTS
ncbi:MAG: N-acyl homoserine lactone hydrolase [Gaiellaceae bacterium]|nr:N-acyl homoserine lactone hydrolase [Gaiellaceae bacterium]